MKKILSLVLAMMMVLSMANVAFAAPEDVTDKNQVKAVDALISLGIVKGYEDGSYKPEKVVTRAELAKMLVEALGQGDLVAGSESSFKDAKGTWYDGYVALASGLELVTGYPDGTFKGDNPVSYQEAVVMVLRALGYTNQTVNGGVDAYNPTKYKTLAQTLGVLANVTFKNGGANRGDIASMIYNSLEIDRVEKSEKGLAQKIVVGKELVQVPGSSPAVYKEEPVYEILLDKLTTKQNVAVTPASLDSTNKAYRGDMVDLEQYMYQTIEAYTNSKGHVMFVKKSKTPVVKGTVSAMRSTDVQWGANTNNKVFVTKDDKTVERVQWNATATIDVYYNGGVFNAQLSDFQRSEDLAGGVTGASGEFDGADVTLVLNSSDVIVAAVARAYNDTVQVASAYKAGNTALTVKRGTNTGILNLPKNSTGKVDLSKVVITGEVNAIEDIVANDVLIVYYAAGDGTTPAKVEIDVCRDTIEGKVTKVDANGYRVIDGEAYYTWRGVANLGDEGKFFLNSDGDIVGFVGKSLSNANYSLITALEPGTRVTPTGGGTDILLKNASIKLLDKDGKSKTYNFTKTATYAYTNSSGTKSTGNVFSDRDYEVLSLPFTRNNQYIVTGFNTNEDGKITLITVKQLTNTNIVNPSSKVFAASSDVVIFSTYKSVSTLPSDDTFVVAKVEDLVKADNYYYAALNSKGEFELIIAHHQLIRTDSYAVITSSERELTSNGEIQNVTAYVKGEKVVFQTAVGVSMGSGVVGSRYLYKLPLSNGVIAQNVTTSSAIMNMDIASPAVMTVATSSANGTISINDMRLSKGATIYVYTQSTVSGGFSFSRVGDESDLSLSNADFKFYNLDGLEGYEIVIISVKR